MNNLKSWQLWLYGLLAAVIGGSSTALVTMFAGKALGTDFTFKQLGLAAATAGVFQALGYLMKSPLPGIENPVLGMEINRRQL